MNTLRIGDKMRQWRNGVGNAPRHYAGTRSATGCALSRTRSLTAAAIAVAMMATVTVSSLIPTYNAKADEPTDGKTCAPASVVLGDDTSVTGTDAGVATYVGGDMYVGGKPSNTSDLSTSTGPTGTYAVEAEGLTVVNGSLAMNPQKEAWKLWNTGNAGGKSYVSRGFRWGVVGFGSQFRPADGKTVLAVGGNTDTSVMGSSKVGAWTAPGWLGKTSSTDKTDHGYKASLAGNVTQVWGKTGVDSIRGLSGSDDTSKQPPVLGTDSTLVTWGQSNNLSNVNGTDYSKYTDKISKLSSDLNNVTKLPATGTVTTSTAPSASSYTIYKYDYRKNGNKGNSFTFYGNLDKEKLITFTSTDTSKSMQVFNLPASDLNLNGTDYTGIDFKFNVPDNASVVVNVTGANGQTIDFHNGWRFWWNNDNIANDFVTAASAADTDQTTKNTNYAKHAQQIMWNFADAQNVVIRGGQATGRITVSNHNSNASTNHGAWGTAEDMQATDDPSAAWMGSILVPQGNLQSHVSTNGRVWVGGDYEMLNNETVKKTSGQSTDHAVGAEFVNESGEKTTSILDMDQERHNLPWNGSYSTSCAAIAWDKVDESGNALDGTSWTVYGTKANAVAGENALATIADGGWNDDADAAGSFKLGNLAPNGTYFLKESGTAEGYTENTNIYQINTTSSTTDAATNIIHVFNSQDDGISEASDKLLTSDSKIINKKTGSSIEWQKVDGTDDSTLLAGSSWTLSKMKSADSSEAEQTWTVTDDQSGTEVKRITIKDASGNTVTSASFTNITPQTFTATAYDQNGQEISGAKLSWSSGDTKVASVVDGTVTPTGSGSTTITVTSADGKVTASFTVTVSGVTVETSVSINDYNDGQEINLEKGKTLKLTASVDPKGNAVEWSTSSPGDVSLSARTGTSVTLTANKVTSSSVTITAKETLTEKFVTLKVNVTKPPATTTTVFFKMQDAFNQNNGQKLFLEWKTSNGSWPANDGDQPNRKEMTVASGCNGYVSYTINEVMPTSASFRIRRDRADNWTSPNAFYRPDANNGFAFKGGDVVTLDSATEILDTAPPGCAVTSTAAYSSRRVTSRSGEHRAVSAVLRAQGSVLNAVNETVSTKVDEDTAAGKFKVSDLADGTYHLQEKTAPNGYEVSDTVYTITITGGNATWSSGITDSKIANTRKTGAVTWTKVSSDTSNKSPLSGSQWTLRQTKTFSWENGVAKYTDVTSGTVLATVTDCVSGENNVTDCSTQTGKYVDLDGAAGKFKISGLGWGEYELVESKAPDGYDLDATSHKFRIGPLEGGNIVGDWYASDNFNTTGTSAYNAETSFTVSGGSIENRPGAILPATGGEGDSWIYATAMAVALISVVAACMALKVRRRQ